MSCTALGRPPMIARLAAHQRLRTHEGAIAPQQAEDPRPKRVNQMLGDPGPLDLLPRGETGLVELAQPERDLAKDQLLVSLAQPGGVLLDPSDAEDFEGRQVSVQQVRRLWTGPTWPLLPPTTAAASPPHAGHTASALVGVGHEPASIALTASVIRTAYASAPTRFLRA